MTDGDAPRVAPATVDDIDPITDLWVALAAGQRRYGSTLLAEENRATVRDWVARSVVTGELLVARPRGEADEDDPGGAETDRGDAEPIGFVGFELDHGDYERDRTRGTVSNLFVVPEHRGEGVGSALLDAAEAALREAGAETVALEALAGNERARAFYAERGYDRHRVELTKSVSPSTDDGDGIE